MHLPTLRSSRRRPLGIVLAGLLAAILTLLPTSASDATTWLGATPARAQGPVDIGILLPSFTDLPFSVQPGQSFPLIANTAPGASCVGQVTFRDLPPIVLDAQTAPNGVCTWTVAVPPVTRPGTATISIGLNRSGQNWSLAGVFYVNAVGESR
jgi:hypothetical protein